MDKSEIEKILKDNVFTHQQWRKIQEEEERAIKNQPTLTEEEWVEFRKSHSRVSP